jgi:hypothetical protein
MKLVIKRLGRIFALVAAMAWAINAQCVLSCSLQVLPSDASYQAEVVHADHPGHACCPGSDHSNPAKGGPAKEKSGHPCSDPLLVGGGVNFADTTHVGGATQYFDPALAPVRVEVVPVRRSIPWSVVADGRTVFSPPIHSALRI